MVDAIRLTDDEVVALAGRLGVPWFGPLPTVDEGDPTALLQSAERGERSFGMSGATVVSAEGVRFDIGELAEHLRAAFGDKPRLLGYVAEEAVPTVPAGISVAIFPDSGETRILTATRPGGVTEFSKLASDEAKEVVRTISRAPDTATTPIAVVLAVPSKGVSGHTLTITAAESHIGTFGPSGLDLQVEGAGPGALEAILADL